MSFFSAVVKNKWKFLLIFFKSHAINTRKLLLVQTTKKMIESGRMMWCVVFFVFFCQGSFTSAITASHSSYDSM